MRTYTIVLLATASCAFAADQTHEWPRLAGEVLVGTAGFEPGVAGEWDFAATRPWRVRPEVLLNEDALPGIACSLSWSIAQGELPMGQQLFIGPRLAYHNERYDHDRRNRAGRVVHDEDDVRYGWEASAFGQYIFPIAPSHPDRHYIEALGGLGIIDKDGDAKPSLTLGAAYAYQF